MEPVDLLAGIPGSEPLAGIDGARTWAIGRFRRYGFLDVSGTTVLRMNVVDGDHSALVADVIAFVRSRDLPAVAGPLVTVPGFSSSGYAFDVLAVPRRDVYDYDAKEFPSLSEVSRVIFPAHTCEFSGRESPAEAVQRVRRALHIGSLSRGPVPFLKVRYRNPTGVTAGTARHFMPYDVVEREIARLERVPDAFVEFETYRGTIWRVSWADGFVADGPRTVTTTLDGALKLARAAIFEGRD